MATPTPLPIGSVSQRPPGKRPKPNLFVRLIRLQSSTLCKHLSRLRRILSGDTSQPRAHQHQRLLANKLTAAASAKMAPTIHCVRHAQGYHNLSIANHSMHDPLLTPYGEQQCRDLQKNFPYHDRVDCVVASPLKRTIYTALLGFPTDIETKDLKVIALPELQETSDLPCDTGSSPAEISKEFQGKPVDIGLVHDGWDSKEGKWAPETSAIEKRAREARRWLMARSEQNIVVVTHGESGVRRTTATASRDAPLTGFRRLPSLLHRRLDGQRSLLGHRLGQHRVPLLHLQRPRARECTPGRDARVPEPAPAPAEAARPQRNLGADAHNLKRGGRKGTTGRFVCRFVRRCHPGQGTMNDDCSRAGGVRSTDRWFRAYSGGQGEESQSERGLRKHCV